MRNADMGYKDYGLSKGDVIRTKEYCRKADAAKKDIIMTVINITNPQIAEQLYNSLVHRMSYERLNKTKYIPMCDRSFYGWRRKVIYELHCLISDK